MSCKRCAVLDNLLDEMREEVAVLRSTLDGTKALGDFYIAGLSGAENIIVRTLLTKNGVVPKEVLMLALYGNRPDSDCNVEIKIIDVLVCKIRRKLGVAGKLVKTVWGTGYEISACDRERFISLGRQTANIEDEVRDVA